MQSSSNDHFRGLRAWWLVIANAPVSCVKQPPNSEKRVVFPDWLWGTSSAVIVMEKDRQSSMCYIVHSVLVSRRFSPVVAVSKIEAVKVESE